MKEDDREYLTGHQRESHYCRECELNPCPVSELFLVAQPNRCPDFKAVEPHKVGYNHDGYPWGDDDK